MTGARTAALAFLVGSGPLGAAAQDTPTFATGIEAIRVDVRVTQRERVVLGLKAVDFEVRDNGVLQDVELVSSEKLPLNVVLALDTSGSVAGEPLDHLRSAGLTLLSRLLPEDRAGLVTFSHEVTLREGLTRDLDRLRRALAAVEPRGETAVIDGSYAAMMVGEADVGRDLLIVFSDGVDTSSWLRASQVLEAARRSNVIIYGVSVRGTVEPNFLDRLTQIAGGALLEVESMRDLSAAFVGILDEFRSRYILSYSPQGVVSAGWHQIEVKVRGGRGVTRARAGYVGPEAPQGRSASPRSEAEDGRPLPALALATERRAFASPARRAQRSGRSGLCSRPCACESALRSSWPDLSVAVNRTRLDQAMRRLPGAAWIVPCSPCTSRHRRRSPRSTRATPRRRPASR